MVVGLDEARPDGEQDGESDDAWAGSRVGRKKDAEDPNQAREQRKRDGHGGLQVEFSRGTYDPQGQSKAAPPRIGALHDAARCYSILVMSPTKKLMFRVAAAVAAFELLAWAALAISRVN
jgi:hypothetical protein